ncbi:MAG: sarcosine oxidase [Saprospirales bacterium]|nr:sarcosine oxidase [Saprospirales bacterium]
MRIQIIGGGVFGLSVALELRQRGHAVRVFDAGPIPHPDASSTDISKLVRADYGADVFYTGLMEQAFPLWQAWNERAGEELYRQVGFLLLSEKAFSEGGFEHESYRLLSERGYTLERLDAAGIAQRFPVFAEGKYEAAYFNPKAGWAASGRVVELLARWCQQAGVHVAAGEGMNKLLEEKGRIAGFESTSGRKHLADLTILAAGAWTLALLPELRKRLRAVGQPVFHLLLPSEKSQFWLNMPGWCADISNTGWYGFPAQKNGILKIARHGPGILPDADSKWSIPQKEWEAFRQFLATALPGLTDVPVAATRVCRYCDSIDSDFLIDLHPNRPGLMVMSGGSGHGFKFAPVLGRIAADVVEGKANPFAQRFRWDRPLTARKEAARFNPFDTEDLKN